jgi:ABC-type sugar transport system ATPase subunit
LALSDRILVMQKGVAQQIGAPEEIYHTPVNLFVMSFIGSSNALKGKVINHDNGKITVAGETWQLSLPLKAQHAIGTPLHVAFRPEHGQIHFNNLPDHHEAIALAGEIKSVEFGGSHWLVQCEIDRQLCLVRAPAEELKNVMLRNLMNAGKIHLVIPPQHVRLFEAYA